MKATKMKKYVLLAAIMFLCTLGCPFPSGAEVTMSVLHSFDGNTENCGETSEEGSYPWGSLTLSSDGSTLYGMTQQGGYNFCDEEEDFDWYGIIFKIGTNGTYTRLYSFMNNATSGYQPLGSLTLSTGGTTLYGMTYGGGASGYGTIFKIGTNGTYTHLYSFKGNSTSGTNPEGSLTLSSDGKTLYGMTYGGGSSGYGTIFKIIGTNGTYTHLYSFKGNSTSGKAPYGSLTFSSDGKTLYGTTSRGGSSTNGTIFKIGTNGTYTHLHSFTGSANDGKWPVGSLTLSSDDTTLYGMTLRGGSQNLGSIFKIGTNGTYTHVHSFTGGVADGIYPRGSLTFSADGKTLFGMSDLGGAATGDGKGTIFRIGTNGTYTHLYSFQGNSTSGWSPKGDLTLGGSTLYGMTNWGGAHSQGTVFKLEGATAIDLLSFKAKGYKSRVDLSWETGSETDNAGFHIHRSLRLRGDYAQITSGLIPAEGSPSEGAKYAYVDREVEPGTSYFYKLEDVDNSGAGTLHGPVSARTATPPITLVSPADSIALPRTSPTFKWKAAGLKQYQIQFSQNASFTGQKLTPFKVISGSGYRPTAFEWKAVTAYMGKSNTVYWRVTGKNSGGKTVASEVFSFHKK